ncbi:MAG: DNA-directed RNA polymerase subunit D [Candidatus Pacearchaeota archaeon]|nr:DNA-directed RNA polymerase subunit D [Candidatus Pacearchaeota archaeon]
MAIKIEKLSKEKEKISFIVRGINNSVANAIRRSVLEIPTLAIDTVEFYKNDSALYDEILAHRLGLVPLKATKTFVQRGKCTCKGKGCLKCTATFKLNTKGPKTVYTQDLKSKGVEVAYPEMPLIFLNKDQEIQLTAEATLGIGKEHAKFTPGLLWFNSYPIIEIEGCAGAEDFVKVCPRKAITIKDKRVSIDPLKCDICGACVEYSKNKEKCSIKITPSEEDFIFYIESFGQTKPEEIFIDAIKAIDDNLDKIVKDSKKFK